MPEQAWFDNMCVSLSRPLLPGRVRPDPRSFPSQAREAQGLAGKRARGRVELYERRDVGRHVPQQRPAPVPAVAGVPPANPSRPLGLPTLVELPDPHRPAHVPGQQDELPVARRPHALHGRHHLPLQPVERCPRQHRRPALTHREHDGYPVVLVGPPGVVVCVPPCVCRPGWLPPAQRPVC